MYVKGLSPLIKRDVFILVVSIMKQGIKVDFCALEDLCILTNEVREL